MPEINPLFDDIRFDCAYEDAFGTLHLFYIAPKEFLKEMYKDAISMEICLEVSEKNFDPDYIIVRFSPTKETEGGTVDYDWFDAYLPHSVIKKLIKQFKRYYADRLSL